MNQAMETKIQAILATAGQASPQSEVLAHLMAMNTCLVISSPLAADSWSAQERAQHQTGVFLHWTFLCRAMARLEDEHPLAAENGAEAAKRILDAWQMGEAQP